MYINICVVNYKVYHIHILNQEISFNEDIPLEKYTTIHNEILLEEELKIVLDSRKKKYRKLKLSEALSLDMVQLNKSVDSWEEAVELCSQPLLDKKFIEESYITWMKKNIKNLRAYVVIKKGVALPHAKPEDGVNRVGFSLLTLKEGVKFYHPVNDPVRLILVVANMDAKSHLHALDTFVSMIKDKKTLMRLIMVKTYDELIKIIKEYEGEIK